MTETSTAQFASPVAVLTYGEYRINRAPDDPRPPYRFANRITATGSSGFKAEPGRFR